MAYEVYNKKKNKGPVILWIIVLLCVANMAWWFYKNPDKLPKSDNATINEVLRLYEAVTKPTDETNDSTDEGAKDESKESSKDSSKKKESSKKSDDGVIKMKGTCYHYDQLDPEEKQVYQYLYQGCKEYASEVKIVPIDKESCERAIFAFRRDHPEFYWTLDDMRLWSSYSGAVEKLSIAVPSDAKANKKKIKKLADKILEGAPDDDYGKVKYIYEYIINNTDYDLNAPDNQTVCSVLLYKASVCGGYTNAFLYLCDRAGIECGYVSGDIVGRDTHAWNFVKIDGQYYWVDVTWGDPNYGYFSEGTETIHYDYLCATDDEILPERILTNDPAYSDYDEKYVFEYPSCTDMSLNYFMQHGSYFDTYDREAVLSSILSQAEDPNNNLVVLKFSSKEVLDQASDDIFSTGLYWWVISDELQIRYGINVGNGSAYSLQGLNHLVIRIR